MRLWDTGRSQQLWGKLNANNDQIYIYVWSNT